MKKSFCRAAFAILIFLFCPPAFAQEAYTPELIGAFNNAGIQLLRQRIAPPDFTLPLAASLGTTARNLSLGSLRGKVVFLNFWATWCGPCRAEMPSMEALYLRYRDRGLEILAVNSREANSEALNFMRSAGLSFPAVLDGNGRVSMAYGIQAIPTSFLIDREGMIIARTVGSIDWDTPAVRAVFDQLLK